MTAIWAVRAVAPVQQRVAYAAAVEVATAAMPAAAPVQQLREAALAMAVESACYPLWGFRSSSSYSPPATASAAASPQSLVRVHVRPPPPAAP